MSRKTARQALVSLFAGQGFNQVYSYAPTDLKRATKVLCIYSAETTYEMLSLHLNTSLFTFALDVYILRDNTTEEDDLDDMHEVIRSVVRANITNSEWDNLDLTRASEPQFAEVSGVPYRVERFLLTVKQQGV